MKNPVTVSEITHAKCTHAVMYPGQDGKRKRKYFTSETAAIDFAEKRMSELGLNGSAFGTIGDGERVALTFWRSFISSTSTKPPDLLAVLREYEKSWKASKASVKLSDGVEKYLATQKANGASKRHLASLKSRLERLASDHGEMLISKMTTSIFSDWLNGLKSKRQDSIGQDLAPLSRHNFTSITRSFFVFAIERGWTLINPVPNSKRSKTKSAKMANRTAPAIMLPSDVEKFMMALSKPDVVSIKAQSLIPFWSIKFFAGIRDAEAARMDWSMIDLDAGKIHIPADISKTGEQRTVKIEPNLSAWLMPYAKDAGRIAPEQSTRQRVFKNAITHLAERNAKGKITKAFIFPSNAARHCFGTFHLFHFRNAGETALQLGHKSNPAMLHEHYKNPTAEKHAAAFWDITPAMKAENVTSISEGRRTA